MRIIGVCVLTAEVTVKSQKGKRVFGHKVGGKVPFDGRRVNGDICYSALTVLLPRVFAMRYNASFRWAENNDVICNACPDGENPVVFEIRRVADKGHKKKQ